MPTTTPPVKAAPGSVDGAVMIRATLLPLLVLSLGCAVEHGGLSSGADEDGGMDAPPFAAPPRGGTGGTSAPPAASGPEAGRPMMPPAPMPGPAPGMTPDAAAPASMAVAGSVECGATAKCPIEGSNCCIGPTGATCTAGTGNCATGAQRRCDGPEDCKGEVCCARADNGPGLYRTACGGSCQMGFGLCHSAADCGGQKCCAVTLGGVTLNLCRPSC